HEGSHKLKATSGDIVFTGGVGLGAYAQAGNGGWEAAGNHSGDHTLEASGNIVFTSGDFHATYAQAGNGGYYAKGSHEGSHTLKATNGDIRFISKYENVHAGNGGYQADGDHQGNLTLEAGGNIVFKGGTTGEAYAQAGNG